MCPGGVVRPVPIAFCATPRSLPLPSVRCARRSETLQWTHAIARGKIREHLLGGCLAAFFQALIAQAVAKMCIKSLVTEGIDIVDSHPSTDPRSRAPTAPSRRAVIESTSRPASVIPYVCRDRWGNLLTAGRRFGLRMGVGSAAAETGNLTRSSAATCWRTGGRGTRRALI